MNSLGNLIASTSLSDDGLDKDDVDQGATGTHVSFPSLADLETKAKGNYSKAQKQAAKFEMTHKIANQGFGVEKSPGGEMAKTGQGSPASSSPAGSTKTSTLPHHQGKPRFSDPEPQYALRAPPTAPTRHLPSSLPRPKEKPATDLTYQISKEEGALIMRIGEPDEERREGIVRLWISDDWEHLMHAHESISIVHFMRAVESIPSNSRRIAKIGIASLNFEIMKKIGDQAIHGYILQPEYSLFNLIF